eukprot:2141680-Alexandrium_andersonii.AAC.1
MPWACRGPARAPCSRLGSPWRLPRRRWAQSRACRSSCRPEQGLRAPAPRVGPLRAGPVWRAAVVARPRACLHQ